MQVRYKIKNNYRKCWNKNDVLAKKNSCIAKSNLNVMQKVRCHCSKAICNGNGKVLVFEPGGF